MIEVPDSSTSGVEGTQSKGLATVPTTVAPPMQIACVPDAIDGLLATHSRNLGGDVAARLLAASMRDTSNQLAAAHETIAEKSFEERKAIEAATNLKVQVAELKGRITQLEGSSRTNSICTFAGTALLGLAIDLYKNNISVPALLIAALGAGLLAFVAFQSKGAQS